MSKRFPVDLHTHTIASDHAYSTLEECIARAPRNGLVMFACTDHGMAIKDSPYRGHFTNMGVVPRICDGNVAVLRGIEANIMDDGSLDIDEQVASRLDIVLAGFHPNLPPSDDVKANTRRLLKVIRSGLADVISHPGVAAYPSDYEAVAECARECGVGDQLLVLHQHPPGVPWELREDRQDLQGSWKHRLAWLRCPHQLLHGQF